MENETERLKRNMKFVSPEDVEIAYNFLTEVFSDYIIDPQSIFIKNLTYEVLLNSLFSISDIENKLDIEYFNKFKNSFDNFKTFKDIESLLEEQNKFFRKLNYLYYTPTLKVLDSKNNLFLLPLRVIDTIRSTNNIYERLKYSESKIIIRIVNLELFNSHFSDQNKITLSDLDNSGIEFEICELNNKIKIDNPIFYSSYKKEELYSDILDKEFPDKKQIQSLKDHLDDSYSSCNVIFYELSVKEKMDLHINFGHEYFFKFIPQIYKKENHTKKFLHYIENIFFITLDLHKQNKK